MKLLSIIESVITEASIEMLQRDFVDAGKLSQEIFDEIVNVSKKKAAYATWLTKKVVDGLIKPEELKDWGEHLQFFTRRKRSFPSPDLNSYKTEKDLKDFIGSMEKIKKQEKVDPASAKGVAKKDKYQDLLIGVVDGYKVYEFPKGSHDLYGASCDLGAGTGLCTASGKARDHFDRYMREGNLYYFIKGSGPDKEVYAFSYANDEFNDKNNNSIFSVMQPDDDLEEMSMTGTGGGMSAGSGAQYATPKAFKKVKKEAKSTKDSYNPDWSSGEVRRQIGSQQTQQTHRVKKGKGSYRRKPKHRNRDQY